MEIKEKRKDNSQAIFNILSQVVLNGVNFILIMLFTRYLSTDEYGIVSIYQAYVLFFAIIIGLNVQGSIGTAFVHINEDEHADYLSSIMLLSLISFCTIIGLTVAFGKPFSNFSELSVGLLILMICHSFGNYCFNFANIKYVYERKAQFSCLMAILVAGSMVLLSIAVVRLDNLPFVPYMGRILSLAVPYIGCALFVMITVFLKGNPFRKLNKYWAFCLPICIPLVFHGISQVVLGQTDKIMLQKLLMDNGVVGVYSFMVTFVHVLNAIFVALNNTWIPIYYEYLKKDDFNSIIGRSKRYNDFYTYLVIGFILVSPEVVKLFADQKYWDAMSIIPIVAASVYMVFLYSFAVNFELFHRESRWIAVGTTLAAIFNIVFNALLIKPYGMHGAAIATLASYLLLFVFHSICSSRIIKGHFPYTIRFYLRNIAIVILVSGFYWMFEDLWYVRWAAAVIVGVVIIKDVYKYRTLF